MEIGFEGGGTTAQSEYAQLQAMAQHACATEVSRAVSAAATTAAAKQVASCAAAAAAAAAASAAASHFDAQYGASMKTKPPPDVGGDAFGSAPLNGFSSGGSSSSFLAAGGGGGSSTSSSSSWNVPSTGGGGGGGGRPRLLDASCREGSFGGGMPVWLHGEHFSHDLHVRFGSAGASSVNVISHNLIKCQAPACFAFSGQARHEVTISLVVASTSAPVPGSIPFVYVHGGSGGGFSGAMGSVPAPPFELLRRLLHSLERAQAAAAAAAATSHLGDSSSTDLDLGLSAFSAMDEHGFSLAEYADELKLCLLEGGHAQSGDASELQSQLGDLATVLKRERLASSLARRPSVDILRQSNILPDHTVDERREALLHSLANRPGLESLQQRHILGYTADEKQEQLAKRKRLEGFLAERPTPEQVMTSDDL